ncbi:MAG: hypothetical protein Q9173_000601, partial [Seirophora scorigena]
MPHKCHEILGRKPATKVLEALELKEWRYKGKIIEYDDIGSAFCKLKFGPLAPKAVKTLEPDGSIIVDGARLPFIIFEVGFSQTQQELDDKVQDWLEGCRNHIKIICVFHINKVAGTPGEYRVLMDVIRHRAILTQRLATSFRVGPNYIIRDEEIYPTRSSATFDIHLAEVFRKDWGEPPAADHLTINVDSFFQQSARRAVRYTQKQAAARDADHPSLSSYDSDQEEPQTLESATSGSSEHDEVESDGDAVEHNEYYELSDDDD